MATRRSAKAAKAVRKPVKAVKKLATRVQQASRTVAARTVARATAANDYEGARQLLSRYCFALDRGRLTDLGPLFHRDAVFSVSFENGQRHTGRETIQARFELGGSPQGKLRIRTDGIPAIGKTRHSAQGAPALAPDPDGRLRRLRRFR